MNSIEEMMEKFGVEKEECPKNNYDELCIEYGYCFNAPLCKIYPKFTHEKQLKVLNFLAKYPDIDSIKQRYDKESKKWEITVNLVSQKIECKCSFTYAHNDFASCVANLLTALCSKLFDDLHLSLTQAQIQEIKEILEG